MKARMISAAVLISFLFSVCGFAQEKTAPASGMNLKVGENFYFEGNTNQKDDDQKEATMAEIKRTPFYESTWFIATVSVLVVGGLSTGIYFLTKTSDPEQNTISWNSSSK